MEEIMENGKKCVHCSSTNLKELKDGFVKFHMNREHSELNVVLKPIISLVVCMECNNIMMFAYPNAEEFVKNMKSKL